MIIKGADLYKIYNKGMPNEVKAVNGVNLEIKEGEFVVIRGISGSGKTTLLHLIGGITRPTSGRIEVAGKEITHLSEDKRTIHRRRYIGFIFQRLNLIGDMSVEINISLPLYPLNIPGKDRERRVIRLLERFGLIKRRDFMVKKLSLGEEQRVAIARALINNPEIILADEPTASLDTGLTQEFINIMEELKAEGKTVLITTHDPAIYENNIVDKVIFMMDGKICYG
jgi:putative ABC transport system ATP-binding protein